MQEKSTPQEQLQIQSMIKEREGNLIRDAKDLIDEEKNINGQALHIYDNKILEEKQVRNVLDVALEADCVEVIEVFIQYQIGRSGRKSDEKWKFANFGERLVEKIHENIHKMASDIALKLKLNEHVNSIWLQLTRLYLGHLNRYFYYRKNEG